MGAMGLIEDWVGGDGSLTGIRDDMGAEYRRGSLASGLLIHYYLPGFASNFETGMAGCKVLHCGEIGVGEK